MTGQKAAAIIRGCGVVVGVGSFLLWWILTVEAVTAFCKYGKRLLLGLLGTHQQVRMSKP